METQDEEEEEADLSPDNGGPEERSDDVTGQ